MKKTIGYKLLYGASVLMIVGFWIHIAVDWYQYQSTLNSAPFWLWILVDAVLWLIPAGIAASAATYVKKKLFSKEKNNGIGK